MSKQISRQVLVKGESVEALFMKDGKTDFMVRLGNSRFQVASVGANAWQGCSMNTDRRGAPARTPFKAYCKFVRLVLKTNPKTGRALA